MCCLVKSRGGFCRVPFPGCIRFWSGGVQMCTQGPRRAGVQLCGNCSCQPSYVTGQQGHSGAKITGHALQISILRTACIQGCKMWGFAIRLTGHLCCTGRAPVTCLLCADLAGGLHTSGTLHATSTVATCHPVNIPAIQRWADAGAGGGAFRANAFQHQS